MEQAEGLCAPGSATTTSYVTINLEPQSSQFVTFSAVPMVTGAIPIKIRLFDIVNTLGIDAIEKTLNVLVSDNILCRTLTIDRTGWTPQWCSSHLAWCCLTLQTEGVEKTDEETRVFNLSGKWLIHSWKLFQPLVFFVCVSDLMMDLCLCRYNIDREKWKCFHYWWLLTRWHSPRLHLQHFCLCWGCVPLRRHRLSI